MRNVELNFTNVEVGETVVKSIKVMNDSSEEQTYEVKRDPGTNPLDHVFNLRNYSWKLMPGESYMIEVSYRPIFAFSKSVDYFVVLDLSDALVQIVARGFSIGPRVESSTQKVVLYAESKNSPVQKRIKLINQSKARAIFMFDIDIHYSVFTIVPMFGEIGPKGKENVLITFTPPEEGEYTFFLPCLILHQEPLTITLHAYCGKLQFSSEELSELHCLWQIEDKFAGYMCDNIYTTSPLPPISLSKNYFIFLNVNKENNLKAPQAICITNLTQDDLTIKWDTDTDGIFVVTPSKALVRAYEPILFEIRFFPNDKHPFFSREIVALVFIEDEEEKYFQFPYQTSIRAIGNSLPASSVAWIPEYEIPHSVVMPPCLPHRLVHTTFLLKTSGKLPIIFRFLPPEVTRFTVKPMIGVIHSNYQIVAVEMSSNPKDKEIYVERWAIQLNGNEKDEIYVDFKGYAEYANVCFSNSNLVNFPATHPGCKHVERVPMRNVTRHTLKYQFRDLPPVLTIQPANGEINSNEIFWHDWIFCPEAILDYDFEVECDLNILENDIPVGSKTSVSLHVLGKGEEGFLLAVPSELNFREQEYNSTRTLMFHVFNLSGVNIYFKIFCQHRNWPLGNIEEDVIINPVIGTLSPGNHEQITVSITPRTLGYYELSLKYLIRIDSNTEMITPDQESRHLCEIHCTCIIPIVQVQNIYCYGTSPNVSKCLLWKCMKIDRLNEIFKHILPGNKEEVNIINAPMIFEKDNIVIKIILSNSSHISLPWNLKRIYNCDCKPIIKHRGLSHRYKEFKCIHEDLCIVSPTSGTLKRQRQGELLIELRSTLMGKSKFSWDLDIGHNRHIILNIIMECVSGTECSFHFSHGSTLNFGRVHIGYKEPVCRALWIRNVSNTNLPFSIDVTPICDLNRIYNSQIFSCMTTRDVITANSAKPVILQFQPRLFERFQVTLPVKVGDTKAEFILKGEGSYEPILMQWKDFMPTASIRTLEFPVHFNVDCIDLTSLTTYSYATRMLLIHNNSSHDTLSYDWKCRKIPDILDVDIEPCKGIIQANTSRSFIVTIWSKGQPIKIELGLTCEFLNVSERREYQRSVLKYNILKEEFKDQFIITEKGVHVPELSKEIFNQPKPFYKTLSIRCAIHNSENDPPTMTLAEELKCTPRNLISYKKKRDKITMITANVIPICVFILEGMLWNIINSKRFLSTMQETVHSGMNLQYSQFSMQTWERKKFIERSYISPPWGLINSIFEKMIFLLLHEEFCLETVHLIRPDDIRHINHLKLTDKKSDRRYRRSDEVKSVDTKIVDDLDLTLPRTESTWKVSFQE